MKKFETKVIVYDDGKTEMQCVIASDVKNRVDENKAILAAHMFADIADMILTTADRAVSEEVGCSIDRGK